MAEQKGHKKWIRWAIVFGLPALVIIFAIWPILLSPLEKSFRAIAEFNKLWMITIGSGAIWGIAHLIFAPKGEIAREHLLYKKLGPVGSSPLTGLTHGIFIHGGIRIIHLFVYGDFQLMKYNDVDKTTVTITMLAIITYSVYSLYLMCHDIIKSTANDKFGVVVKKEEE